MHQDETMQFDDVSDRYRTGTPWSNEQNWEHPETSRRLRVAFTFYGVKLKAKHNAKQRIIRDNKRITTTSCGLHPPMG